MQNQESKKPKNAWLNYLVGILIAALALFLLNKLTDSSSLNYYITLVIVAFASALAVFSIQKSFASFDSTSQYGTLKLGGPVVVFFLVIIGGYYLPKNNFDLTINVYDSKSGAITNGSIVINIDDKKEERMLDNNGQASFKKILSEYRGIKASIEPKIKNYPATAIEITIPKKENVITITLEKNIDSTLVHGSVINIKNIPVKDAIINFMGGKIKATTDNLGNYAVYLPIAEGVEVGVMIIVKDSIVYNDRINVGATNETNFYLK
ncbi:MAG: hypothetical protein ABI723_07645 [Bacteroidia bacterium]